MKIQMQSIFIAVMVVLPFIIEAQTINLTLNEALQMARENNKSLQGKSIDTSIADEDIRISRSHLLPSVNVSGNYSYYFDRQVIFMPGAFTGDDNQPVVDVAVGGKNAFNGMISLSQPLLNEEARKQIKTSRVKRLISETEFKEMHSDLTVETSTLYLKSLLISTNIRLTAQSLERNMRSLSDSRSLYAQGKSLKVDTLRNFIVVENLKTMISHQENQLKATLLQLKQLIGLPMESDVFLSDSLNSYVETRHFPAVEKSLNDRIHERPDVKQTQLTIDLYRNALAKTRATRMPNISLVGAYQIQAQSDNRKFESFHWPATSFVGLQANVPLFSGNRLNAKIRQSALMLQKSEIAYVDAKEKAQIEIETLQSNLRELFQRLVIQQKTVEAAEMNFNVINDRYRNGLSSRLELSDAELSLTEAKMNELQWIYNIKIAKLKLDKALGLLQ